MCAAERARLCERADTTGQAAAAACDVARTCEGAWWDARSDDFFVQQSARWHLVDACHTGGAERDACDAARACDAKADVCASAAEDNQAAIDACLAQASACEQMVT